MSDSKYRLFQGYIVDKVNYFIAILIILYVVGFLGFVYQPALFLKFTPVFLILNFVFILLFQSHRTATFLRFCIIVFTLGFAIEMIGVSTGKIFGYYHYGDGLGFKLKQTPLLIGLNWLLLTYASAQLANASIKGEYVFFKAIIGGFFMVLIDIFLEMVAPHLDFWYWDGDIIPFQNFVSWLIISFFFNLLYQTMNFKSQNKIAPTVFLLQFLFFLGLSFKFSSKIENKQMKKGKNFWIKTNSDKK